LAKIAVVSPPPSLTHPDLQEITIRWRGAFGYMDAWAGEGDNDDERILWVPKTYVTWVFASRRPWGQCRVSARAWRLVAGLQASGRAMIFGLWA
jgi:hypothetical protein